jgi:hypothetical protein
MGIDLFAGEVLYRKGQPIGVITDGVDKNGKPHKLRLCSIPTREIGDFRRSVHPPAAPPQLTTTMQGGYGAPSLLHEVSGLVIL